jgi:hypothetical protein
MGKTNETSKTNDIDNKTNEININTTHQELVFDTVTDYGFTCPQCKSTGGQHLHIENVGDSWTQTWCCYCSEFINLDNYYTKK